jgi:hypothetical protein
MNWALNNRATMRQRMIIRELLDAIEAERMSTRQYSARRSLKTAYTCYDRLDFCRNRPRRYKRCLNKCLKRSHRLTGDSLKCSSIPFTSESASLANTTLKNSWKVWDDSYPCAHLVQPTSKTLVIFPMAKSDFLTLAASRTRYATLYVFA